MRLRHLVPPVLTLVLALALLAGCASASANPPSTTQTASGQLRASDVVEHSFSILNAGMQSGNFSALNSVVASNATLTRSSLDGKTSVYHGLATIIRFYDTLPSQVPGFQWTTDSMRTLSPTVVLNYEHAGTSSMAVPSRCAHVFVIENGKIVSYDWVVFFPGKK
jgi:hypothetical protein